MQCQLCDKPATVHLTEITDGEKRERHLCEECAQKEGVTIKTHVPISELLSSLIESQDESHEISELRCPQCGVSWSEFRKRGSLGCPNDYQVFSEPLAKLIEKAQGGATEHTGRKPRKTASGPDDQEKLLKFRHELQQAVDAEDYEMAARLRDEIRKLL